MANIKHIEMDQKYVHSVITRFINGLFLTIYINRDIWEYSKKFPSVTLYN